MSDFLMMFRMGVGAGLWVAGAGLVLTLALPVIAILFRVIGMIFGQRKDDAA